MEAVVLAKQFHERTPSSALLPVSLSANRSTVHEEAMHVGLQILRANQPQRAKLCNLIAVQPGGSYSRPSLIRCQTAPLHQAVQVDPL